MKNYDHIRVHCQSISKLSASVIDEFIIYYAATQDRVDREFDDRLDRFRHIKNEFSGDSIRKMKAQYIAHRIFRRGGLISRYLSHSAIKKLEADQQDFLALAAANPWRFSFSVITDNPAPDFYEMSDIFSGDSFLLFSPSTTVMLGEQSPNLWFNLIAFNGSCWQSFGPVIHYSSFDEDDIFFYATELNPLIDSESDLMKDVEETPVPYMLLLLGANFPRFVQAEFESVQVIGERELVNPDLNALKKEFKLEYVEDIFRISHQELSEPPHFAQAYFEEKTQMISLHALTDEGYHQMATLLGRYQMHLPPFPDIRLHNQMIVTLEKLLKKKLELNPFEKKFEIKQSPEDEAMLNKFNHALHLALPSVNEGKEPDVMAIAKEVGLDPGVVKDLLQKTMKNIMDQRRKYQ